MEEKYQKIREIVEKELAHSAHNIDHVQRVHNLSVRIAEGEPGVDIDVLKTAALLHDIARDKEDTDESRKIRHEVLGAEMAEKILTDLDYPKDKINAIKHCIVTHRFRSGAEPQTKEAKILFDADKLDIIGAIGIGRSFMFAGQCREKMYSDVPIEEYLKDNVIGGKPNGRLKDVTKHAPNLEFELKCKHILDRLYTQKAKEIGKERLAYVEAFFERLKKEIDGKL